MSSKSATGYHLQCSGQAATTADAHTKQDATITAYFACFCPFVQRAWIALEFLGQGIAQEEAKEMGIDYWYVEVDPYKKPKELLEVGPKGLVPLPTSTGKPNALLPSDPYKRARYLLAGQKHADALTPAFYRYLQAQDAEKQVQYGREYVEALEAFEKEMHPSGPFFFGDELGWVDILIAPWAIRFEPVLKHYRGFNPSLLSDKQRRFSKWYEAIKNHPAVAATTSTEELYTDSYHRYANNIPNLSQVADAINSGKALP
ncbi:hypothetical protein QFC22_002802 [Naganishia vaughanmartiniae]|uniref:Uncharacterized protein n=1 Tax=Naganishia vaughanmartiniae TaxID=1424756 RepID=A0ACC2XC52_9TREE|nr:hypothetical protein QFC22_002802 [Naganishia vaughanmartiniae]